MPPELIQLLTQLFYGFASIGVALVFELVLELFGVDLKEFSSATIAVLVNLGLAFAAGLFAQIPADFAPYVATLAILVLTWILKYFQRKQVRAVYAKAKIKFARTL